MPRQILLTATAITLVACTQQPTYSPPRPTPSQALIADYAADRRAAIAEMATLAKSGAADRASMGDAAFVTGVTDRLRRAARDAETMRIKDVVIVDYKGGTIVCGQVNARSGLGGYDGFRRFAGTPAAVRLEQRTGLAGDDGVANAGINDACGR